MYQEIRFAHIYENIRIIYLEICCEIDSMAKSFSWLILSPHLELKLISIFIR